MSDHNFVAGLLSKLGVTSDTAKKAVDILNDSELSKTQHAQSGGPVIPDRWQEGQMHKVPSPAQLKIGPTQESSGAGAEKMTDEYSNPAPQMGLQVQAERLAAELGSLRGYAKSIGDYAQSIADHHNELVDVVKSTNTQVGNLTTVVSAVISKAEDEEKKKEKDKEDMEHCEKATSLLAQGKKLLKKAKRIKVEAKAETDPDKQASLKAAARLMRKAAARRLYKAQIEALAGKGLSVDYTYETRKAISALIRENPSLDIFLKAFHDKDDDEEEDEEKKAKKAYKKAQATVVSPGEGTVAKDIVGHKDAKGNQSDKKDTNNSDNQDDSAVKAVIEAQVAETNKKIDDALNGFGLLKTDVQGLMDAISGRATKPLASAEIVPLMKSVNDTTIEKIAQRINEADEGGIMDTAHVVKARDLLTKLDAVGKGAIHEGIYKSALANAPTAVRELFIAA